MVVELLCDGVGPGTKDRGDHIIAGGQRVKIPCPGVECDLLGGNEPVQFFFLLGEFSGDLLLLGIGGSHQGLRGRGVLFQPVQDLLRLLHLGVLLCPLKLLLGLLLLQSRFRLVKGGQRGLYLLPNGHQGVHHRVVILHDEIHHGKPVQ